MIVAALTTNRIQQSSGMVLAQWLAAVATTIQQHVEPQAIIHPIKDVHAECIG